MKTARPDALPATLDPVLHERMRLAIAHALAVHSKLSFSELKRLLALTDGNLSVHARRLEAVGYITSTKTVVGRTPRTEYQLTIAGERALERYLDHFEVLVRTLRRKYPQ